MDTFPCRHTVSSWRLDLVRFLRPPVLDKLNGLFVTRVTRTEPLPAVFRSGAKKVDMIGPDIPMSHEGEMEDEGIRSMAMWNDGTAPAEGPDPPSDETEELPEV